MGNAIVVPIDTIVGSDTDPRPAGGATTAKPFKYNELTLFDPPYFPLVAVFSKNDGTQATLSFVDNVSGVAQTTSYTLDITNRRLVYDEVPSIIAAQADIDAGNPVGLIFVNLIELAKEDAAAAAAAKKSQAAPVGKWPKGAGLATASEHNWRALVDSLLGLLPQTQAVPSSLKSQLTALGFQVK